MNNFELVPQLDDLRTGEWDLFYETVVRPNVAEHRQRGEYAANARKRRKSEDGG